MRSAAKFAVCIVLAVQAAMAAAEQTHDGVTGKLQGVGHHPKKKSLLIHAEYWTENEKRHNPVNLLSDVNTKRDTVVGVWSVHKDALVSPAIGQGILTLPTDVPKQYDLSLTVKRLNGSNTLTVRLVAANRSFLACVDAHEGRGYCGLELLDGQFVHQNEATAPGGVLDIGKTVKLVFSVRDRGVTVTADGREVVRWRGDYRRLSTHPRVPGDNDLLSLVTYSGFAISQIELTPVTIPGRSDLLEQIDVGRDAVKGKWSVADGKLVSPAEGHAVLRLPKKPPEEYMVTIDIERKSGNNSFGLGIFVDGHRALAGIDVFLARHCGLEMLDGRYVHQNESARPGGILQLGKPTTLVFIVRKTGVTVTANDRVVICWHGDPKRLSLKSDDPKLDKPVQFLISINSTFVISKIELLPLEPTERNANGPIGDFAIIEARWGAFDGWADVTDALQAKVKEGRLHISDLNTVLAKVKDPAFGRHKALIVVYQHRGNTRMAIVPSTAPTGRGGTLKLPEKDKVPGRRANARVVPMYLSDLAPLWVNTFTNGRWGFGNNGFLGARTGGEFLEIMVNGKTFQHSLGTHPRTREGGRVVYDIGRRFRRLSGDAALSDQSGRTRSAITFEIIGDGKSLWRSKAIRESGQRLPFDVNVLGIRRLELVVHCPGHNHSAGAVWIEPILHPAIPKLKEGNREPGPSPSPSPWAGIPVLKRP